MYRYKCVFYVNGIRTETIVNASSWDQAKKLVEAQYSSAKITSFNATRL